MRYIRIEQNSKDHWIRNKFSGHWWNDTIVLNSYKVIGPIGLIKRVRTYGKAEEIAQDWENFYLKFPPY